MGCARHSRNTRGQAARAEQTLHVLTVVILAILDERLIGGDRLFGFLACAHTIGACDRTKHAALRNAVLPRVVQALHDRDKPGLAVLPGRIPDDSLRNLTRVRAGQHAAQCVRGVAIIVEDMGANAGLFRVVAAPRVSDAVHVLLACESARVT